MSLFIKILPILAIAFAPLPVQAHAAPQPGHGGYQNVVHSGANYFRNSFGG